MPSFDEQHQKFTFDDGRWSVVRQYDKHPDYLQKIRKLTGTKAVDFVGLQDGEDGVLYWIEVKEFRGYRIQNKQRLSDGELAQEVAEKVRDSLAGVVGAYQTTSAESDVWRPFVRALWRKAAIRVLLWLEEDNMPRPRGRRDNAAQVLSEEIKKKLKWLTARVFVVGQALGGCPEGLVVADLPGAGQTQ
jgi:hypothetical protein